MASAASPVPEVLDPLNQQHLWAVCEAIQSSTQAPTNEVRKAAEGSLKACEGSAGFADVLLAIIGSDAASAIRVGAVILVKGLVRGSWKPTRGAAARVLSPQEKQRVRDFLVGPTPLQEVDNGVAVQLAVLTSKVARTDWPSEWPALFPALVGVAVSNTGGDGGLGQKRSLYSLHCVLKELETKKFGFDKAAFTATVAQHFGALRAVYGALVGTQRAEGPRRAMLVTLLVKVMYRMVLMGMPGLQLQEGRAWLAQLIDHMQAVITELVAHHSAIPHSAHATSDMEAALEKQLRRCAAVLADCQKNHPIPFLPFLAPSLVFFHDSLLALVDAGAAAGREHVAGAQFCLHCVAFLTAVVGCSCYRQDTLQAGVGKGRVVGAAGDSPMDARTATEIRQTLGAFWMQPRVAHLVQWTIRRLLLLTPADRSSWEDNPEQFVLDQDSLTPSESLRVAAQHLYLGLLESPDHGTDVAAIVQNMLTTSVPLQLEAFGAAAVTEPVLLVDALYLAVGLGTHSLSSDMLRSWVTDVLGPGLQRLLAHATSPPVLLRRGLWAVGCCAAHLTPAVTCDVIALVAAVLSGTAEHSDAAVQLAALGALDAVMQLWVFDPLEALVPVLGPLLDGLFKALNRMSELEARQQVLSALSQVLEISGDKIAPFAMQVVNIVPSVWAAAEDQTPLRTTCLSLMVHVVKAVGSAPGAPQALTPVVVPMITMACDPDADAAGDSYLTEGGLELWLAFVRRSPAYDEKLHGLFPLLPAILSRDLEHAKAGMLLLEAYVLLGGAQLLGAHSTAVAQCLAATAAQVRPSGARFVTRALEAVLQLAPRDGTLLLAPALERLVVSVAASARGEGGCEPDLVIVQHVSVLAHILLGAPDACAALLGGCGMGIFELAQVMMHLFDAVGGGTLGRRRLWCLALASILPQLSAEQAHAVMDQFVNVCVDVLKEEEEPRSPGGRELSGDDVPTDDDDVPAQGAYKAALVAQQQRDAALTGNLRRNVQQAMEACSAHLGPAAFQAVLDTVEPVLLRQLEAMVAAAQQPQLQQQAQAVSPVRTSPHASPGAQQKHPS